MTKILQILLHNYYHFQKAMLMILIQKKKKILKESKKHDLNQQTVVTQKTIKKWSIQIII